MTYYTDFVTGQSRNRHLVCVPYSRENMRRMAADLGIKECWYEKGHYDIPHSRLADVVPMCVVVRPRDIAKIIREKRQ